MLNSCQKDNDIQAPDVSHITVDLEMKRFEKDLMQVDTTNMAAALAKLEEKHPVFLECFLTNIMGIAKQDTLPAYSNNLKKLVTFGGLKAAYDSTILKYPDLKDLKEELVQGFRYFRYYFPDQPVPEIVSYISHYSYGAVTCGDSVIGIGLDLFLGPDYTWYPALQIPSYLTQTMDREYIPANVMKSYAQHHFSFPDAPKNLLAEMIQNGKQLYFLDLVLPKEGDYLKMGFTGEQLEWARKNEGEIWAFFLGEDMLYETSRLKFHKYVTAGPGTPGLPPEAPGNIGSWVGWQIVRKYMEEFDGMGYEELLEKDAQEILRRSGYKPRRK